MKASGKPLGSFCSAYSILRPKLFFSGNIFLNCSNSPLFTIIKGELEQFKKILPEKNN